MGGFRPLVWEEFLYFLSTDALKLTELAKAKAAAVAKENEVDEDDFRDKNGNLLSMTTALQYLSNLLQHVLQKFPRPVEDGADDVLEQLRAPNWIGPFRRALQKKMNTDFIKAGIEVQIRFKGMSRAVLAACVDHIYNNRK